MRAAPTVRIDRSIRRSLQAFDRDRLRWLDEAASLGPLVGLGFGPATVWVLSDPDAARTMLVTDGESWTRPPATRIPIRLGVGENLFTQSDKAWALLQPQVASAFRKRALDARLAGMHDLIETEVAELPNGPTIDLGAATSRLALILAAWMLAGERLDRDRADELVDHQQQIVTWVGHRLSTVRAGVPVAVGKAARAMRSHRRVLEDYGDELITRARQRRGSEHDVLGALIAARPDGRSLRPAALRAHVLGLFFAGNETTAAALCWALVHGARSPHEWRRLVVEPERAPLFVDETLRLTPAVWGLTRSPTRPGVTIQAGGHTVSVRRPEVVTVYLRAANRRPATWPDPLRFDPDRHLATDPRSSRALLAYGLGPRGCIGQHLATAEMTAALPILARHGAVSVDEDVTEDASFALRVAGGLRGRFA